MSQGGAARFLIGFVTGWAVVRAAVLAPWPTVRESERARPVPVAALGHPAVIVPSAATQGATVRAMHPENVHPPVRGEPVENPFLSERMDRASAGPGLVRVGTEQHRSSPEVVPALAGYSAVPPAAPSRRLRGSAWLFARGEGGSSLATGGTLGGGQAGARLSYRLGEGGGGPFAFAGRISRPLHDPGAELAVGLDWQPAGALPVRFSVERRVRLEHGARNAWAGYVAGGVWRPIGRGLVLDGYAQAGVVGLRARDLFADGALRLVRPVAGGPLPVRAGVGLWGAAQPGAERLDVGPHLAASWSTGARTATLAVDGRIRVAGDARPGSGLALMLAADF